jgi:hypothetical protein
MQTAFTVIVCASTLLASWLLWRQRLAKKREAYIRTFAFPKGLFSKVIATHPHLTAKDMQLVSHGLRQFFLAYLHSGKQYVSMPSQVVDALWHEFILYTKNYQDFSQKAFGSFLHHTPAAALTKKSQSNVGLRRCWRYVCLQETINPVKPSRLPLLFALDAKLGIANGYHYVPDCQGVRKAGNSTGANTGQYIHCGGDFSDASFDGSTEGFSLSNDSSSGDGGSGDWGFGSGCGGGCGGD